MDAKKESMRAGLNSSTETTPIKTKPRASLGDVLPTQSCREKNSLSVLNLAMAIIKEKMEGEGDVFRFPTKPNKPQTQLNLKLQSNRLA